MSNELFTGINIQHPISELILSGKKSIETRTYPLPKKYIGVPLLVIETPGKNGEFEARIKGIIKFDTSFKYKNKKEFYDDSLKHFVTKDSPWKWSSKAKWGWPILEIKRFPFEIKAPPQKGIVYTTNIEIKLPV